MYKSNFKIKLLLAASFGSILLPWNAQAMSLGRVIANSSYGEKLDADITLEDADSSFDGSQLVVNLASNDEFNQIGLRKEAYHSGLIFKAYKDQNGQWTIKVRSKEPIKQQFVSFLISADWPSGHNVREYLMILKGKTSNKNSQDELASGLKKSDDFKLAVADDSNKIVRLNDNIVGNSSIASQYKNGDILNLEKTKDLSELSALPESKESTESKEIKEVKEPAEGALPVVNKLSFMTKGDQLIIKPAIKNTEQKKSASVKSNNSVELDATTWLPKKAENTAKPDKSNKTEKTAKSENTPKKQQQAVTVFKSSKPATFHTKNGDNLWVIAKNNAKNGVTINQMMVAIYNSNKNAFNKNNINNLKPNRVLQIPSIEEAKAIDSTIANNFDSLGNKSTVAAKNELIKDAKPAAQNAITTNNNSIKKSVATTEETKPSIQPIQHNLEIVTTSSAGSSSDLMLEAEKLIAKQKENQELKEKSIILQAQLNDMKKLLALKKGGNNSASDQTTVKNTANTPLNSTKMLSSKDKDPYWSFFSNKLADSSQLVGANNNQQSGLMFWIWLVLLAGGSSLGLVYYYWFRYYKIQPAAPDLMNSTSKRNRKEDELAEYDDIAEYADDAFVVEEVKVKTKESFNYQQELNANFDLVKAYIELGDHVNAKKILDVILNNGNTEQKARANKLMASLLINS